MTKVLVFPRDNNPYQNRLHSALPDDITTQYVDVLPDSKMHALLFAPRLFAALIMGRLRGFKVFHLHWLYPFAVPQIIPGHTYLSLVQTICFIRFIRLIGFRLVWTAHNVLPHEPQTADDIRVARLLAATAAATIVHSTATIKQMESLNLSTQAAHVIPHANYIGVYPERLSRTAARKQLGLQPADRVILFFGIIRPHKGIEQLLAAFRTQKLPHTRLVIAGSCTDPALRKALAIAKNDPRIIVHDRHVTDEQVAMYFNACDIVCLPFRAVTTSGSALLAASFGKPLIAPRAGALQDMPAAAGLLYNPETAPDLSTLLTDALSDRQVLQRTGKAARAYADTLSQPAIANQTAALYRQLRAQ